VKKNIITYCLLLCSAVALPQQPDISLLKAKALIDQKKYDDALEYLQHPLKRSVQVYLWLGECYYDKKDFSKAIRFYLEADSISKDIASFELSRCYAEKHENSNAIAWLQRHLALNPKKSELAIVTDPAFADLDETNEWKSLWKQNWYSDQEISRNAIAALIEKGKASDALNELERLKDRFVPKHEYFALQGKAYTKQNLLEPAIASMNEAISLYGRSDDYFALRADLFLKTGKYSDAFDDITKAIHLKPYVPSYYLKRAEISRLAANFQVAEADLKIYREGYPESSETYRQLGLLENARGNYQNALDYYDKLIDKEQGNAQYFIERGNNALAVNQIQKADEDFGMALDLDPTMQEAYLKKGTTRLILQDTMGACFDWNKAKQLGSSEAANLVYKHCKE
jgi:tetratricopeptide (TPR) repeat protein